MTVARRTGQLVTGEVAAFVRDLTLSDVPELAVHRARQAVADLVGVALAGRRQQVGKLIVDHVLEQGARPVAGILGGGGTSRESAALANGVCAHAMDFDDTNHPLYGHPSCSIVPAVLAIGEPSGADVELALTAYVVGFELDAALGGALELSEGFHSTGVIGTIGAAAAAARIHGLDDRGIRHALGIAASRAAGLRTNFGTMTKPLNAGAAAASAVQATLLAARGFDANDAALESPIGFAAAFTGGVSDLAATTSRLGSDWSLMAPYGLAIKPFPSCGATHTGIDAAVAVRELVDEDIARIRVGISGQAPRLLIYADPQTGNEARFSATYTVAAALVRGALGIADFTDAAVTDPAVRTLMSRVEVHVDDRLRDQPQFPTAVEVTTVSGRRVEVVADVARGKNANPMTEAELAAKFADCAGPDAATGLWAAIRHAPLGTPVAELVAATALRGDARQPR
ncbi:MmgE/PrpD family protein [Modestobacter sp. Leaf380]|uniref:MmgE/PrpD family protein n=1 Tax=Modestobacter sp. Leaf380 TaxID=1736356 RepID=UPI0006F8D502|nr:MmgE/PrpD family protein [Modestobacter sp. Leaf380]KQS65709.1 hypothetical protein ASG41_13980 [Modestobacter sp. Leaf380]